LQEPKTYTDSQNSSSRGMHNGGERAVFQALAKEELSREIRENFMI